LFVVIVFILCFFIVKISYDCFFHYAIKEKVSNVEEVAC